jgi:hypothetical protein
LRDQKKREAEKKKEEDRLKEPTPKDELDSMFDGWKRRKAEDQREQRKIVKEAQAMQMARMREREADIAQNKVRWLDGVVLNYLPPLLPSRVPPPPPPPLPHSTYL